VTYESRPWISKEGARLDFIITTNYKNKDVDVCSLINNFVKQKETLFQTFIGV